MLVSPSKEVRQALKDSLSVNGFRLYQSNTGIEAAGLLSSRSFDVIMVEADMEDIQQLLREAKTAGPNVKIVALAPEDNLTKIMEALKMGADGYLVKPLRQADIRVEVEKALTSKAESRRDSGDEKYPFTHRESRNRKMAEIYQSVVNKIARSNTTVLLTGESGTGKELMAYWIYSNSFRKDKPFIKVSCAVLPEGVLESELFGHEKGAFTGAYSKRKGRFELADDGTIFLDEIGEISPAIQSKFLRVLQEKEFQRVGSNQTIKVNVRVIAATSRDLRSEVEKGCFREDLFYRLNVISLHIPPLRERKEDIPDLARLFLRKYLKHTSFNRMSFSDDVMDLLMAYEWPGNVRELENAVERAVVMASSAVIQPDDLPENIVKLLASEPPDELTLKEARERFEMEYIEKTLARFEGNVSKASRYLGLARKNLQEKLKKYSIEADRYRK
ncbi:sigma-54-dependent Fis family transcriptional regulator [bacterium]|nr:sigma-54-dependent Fis family transcriptional regulator [bacterium]